MECVLPTRKRTIYSVTPEAQYVLSLDMIAVVESFGGVLTFYYFCVLHLSFYRIVNKFEHTPPSAYT
jgi:hypothetical protein